MSYNVAQFRAEYQKNTLKKIYFADFEECIDQPLRFLKICDRFI